MAVSAIFWTTVNAFDTPSDERALQAPNNWSQPGPTSVPPGWLLLARALERPQVSLSRRPRERDEASVTADEGHRRRAKSEMAPIAAAPRAWFEVTAGAIDIEGLRHDRNQLWAEAAQAEDAGEPTMLAAELWATVAEAQEARARPVGCAFSQTAVSDSGPIIEATRRALRPKTVVLCRWDLCAVVAAHNSHAFRPSLRRSVVTSVTMPAVAFGDVALPTNGHYGAPILNKRMSGPLINGSVL